MKINLRLVLFCLFLGIRVLNVSAQDGTMSGKLIDQSSFDFRIGNSSLDRNYLQNEQNLAATDAFIRANRSALVAGNAHVELLGFIPSWQVGDPDAVNSASLHASVVRAYLKVQHEVPHNQCSFAIDTTQGISHRVVLRLVEGPIPGSANTQISCTEDRKTTTPYQAMRGYRYGVPYTSYRTILYQSALYAEWEGGDLEAYATEGYTSETDVVADQVQTPVEAEPLTDEPLVVDPVASDDSASESVASDDSASDNVASESTASDDPTDETAPVEPSIFDDFNLDPADEMDETPTKSREKKPIFAIKTNVLYWLTAVPNLELEFFFGRAMSVVAEGQFTWVSMYLPQSSAYFIWNSGLELRHYFRRDKRFSGWYAGLYGQMGQYDLKFFDLFGNVGNQGSYLTGGISLGCVVPIGKHFNMEFGLGVGYVSYLNSTYEWNETRGINEWVARDVSGWAVLPTKASIGLVWKF